MQTIDFSHAPGIWHQATMHDGVFAHRLVLCEVPGTARATEWVQDGDPIEAFGTMVIHFPYPLGPSRIATVEHLRTRR